MMSPREFMSCLEGWNKSKEWEYRQQWEQARYIAKAIVSVQVAQKDRSKLDKAFSLPWDGEANGRKAPKAKALSEEEMKRQEEETIRIARKMQKILG